MGKKIIAFLLVLVCLSGCSKKEPIKYYEIRTYSESSSGDINRSENTYDENGIELMIKPGMTISTGGKDIEPAVYDCATEFLKNLRDGARAELNGEKPSNVYEVPVIDAMLRTVGNKVTDIPKYKAPDQQILRNYSSFVFN